MSVLAIWRGPFEAELANGQTLQPGEQAEVTEADLESAHWERAQSERSETPARRGAVTVPDDEPEKADD